MIITLLADKIHRVSNHPVHIIHGKGKLNPSAFIPFCEFGGNMSAMGVKINQFDDPVCNSFQAKIQNDQLCYEVDLEKYKNKDTFLNDLKLGLVFFMDYNEDRQVVMDEDDNSVEKNSSWVERVDGSDDDRHSYIYLNTIGENISSLVH